LKFRATRLTSKLLHPARGFEPVETEVEVRWDPLTGYAARLVQAAAALLAPSSFDLEAFAARTQEACPFCTERIEQATPKLPREIHSAGRIRRGGAVLFPNLLTYSQYSAVGVYSPALHYLPLAAMTPRLVTDNLAVHVDFIMAVAAADPNAAWASINANHMLPSGSSLFHPHLQGIVDSQPTTIQRQLAASRPSASRSTYGPSAAPASATSATPVASSGWSASPRSPRPSRGRSWPASPRRSSSTPT
jgi:UDPglucose--hexose-1-phosphate uridylyltransferase